MKKELGNFLSVRNMTSNAGNKVKNQFIIETDKGFVFQSYNSVIVAYVSGKTILDANKWDYSATTGKYRNILLGETKKETEKKIKEGIYILDDLN